MALGGTYKWNNGDPQNDNYFGLEEGEEMPEPGVDAVADARESAKQRALDYMVEQN